MEVRYVLICLSAGDKVRRRRKKGAHCWGELNG